MAYDLTSVDNVNSGAANTVWFVLYDGTYWWTGDSGNIRVWGFDGTTLSQRTNYTFGIGSVPSMVYDGTYYHVTSNIGATRKVYALSYDGTTISLVGNSYDVTATLYDIDYDGSYLYVANNSATELLALTFDGTNYALRGGEGSFGYLKVKSNGTYIYALADNHSLYAFSFNGVAFTARGNIATGLTTERFIYLYGDYIFVGGDGPNGLLVYTFNGTTFTLVDAINDGFVRGITYDGTYIIALINPNIVAYPFDGITISSAISSLNLPVEGGYCIDSNATYSITGGLASGTIAAIRMSLRPKILAVPNSDKAPVSVQFYGS